MQPPNDTLRHKLLLGLAMIGGALVGSAATAAYFMRRAARLRLPFIRDTQSISPVAPADSLAAPTTTTSTVMPSLAPTTRTRATSIAVPEAEPVESVSARVWIGRLVGIATIVCFLISGYYFRWYTGAELPPYDALNWLLIAVPLLAVAVWLIRPRFDLFTPTREAVPFRPVTWRLVVVGAFTLLLLAEDNRNLLLSTLQLSQHIQMALLTLGIVFVVVGFGGFFDPSRLRRIDWSITALGTLLLLALVLSGVVPEWRLPPLLQGILMAGGYLSLLAGLGILRAFRQRPAFSSLFSLPRSRLFWALVVIGVIGFGLRIYHLSDAVHILVDELHFVEGQLNLRNSDTTRILYPTSNIAQFTLIFSYFQQITTGIFGPDFVGLRLPSVICGTLTIFAVYLLAKALFDRKTALLAAALLAVFPAHIHFSRTAVNNICDAMFGTFGLAFLVDGLRQNSQRSYALAGVFLGLTAYFYEGGRLVFLALLLSWTGLLIVFYRPRVYVRGLLTFAAVLILVMAPYYYYTLRPDGDLTPRLSDQGRPVYYLMEKLKTRSLGEVLNIHYEDAFRHTLFHTIYSPDGSRFYYGGDVAILNWYVVPFFLLGLFFLLLRRGLARWLFWIWMVLPLLGISLIMGADWTVRFLVMFPAMMILAAVGLRYPLEMIRPHFVPRAVLFGAMVLLVAVIGFVQVRYYFTEHLAIYNRQVRIDPYDFYDAFDRAAAYDPNAELIYVSDGGIFGPVMEQVIEWRQIKLTYQRIHPLAFNQFWLRSRSRERTLIFAIKPIDFDNTILLGNVLPFQRLPASPYSSVPRDRQYMLFAVLPQP